MYFAPATASWPRSSSGVRPTARTSLINGSVIIPSGLTVTSTDMSGSRQNSTPRTSSGPMT
jgi:hypothetical protein